MSFFWLSFMILGGLVMILALVGKEGIKHNPPAFLTSLLFFAGGFMLLGGFVGVNFSYH